MVNYCNKILYMCMCVSSLSLLSIFDTNDSFPNIREVEIMMNQKEVKSVRQPDLFTEQRNKEVGKTKCQSQLPHHQGNMEVSDLIYRPWIKEFFFFSSETYLVIAPERRGYPSNIFISP